MLSLRTAACLLAAIAWLLAIQFAPRKQCFQETGRELDIAILGQGYLEFYDPETTECCYSKSGRLNINPDGQLIRRHMGKEYHLSPEFNIPSNWQQVNISALGEVYVRSNGDSTAPGEWTTIGQIQTSRFQVDQPFANPSALNRINEASGVPFPELADTSATVIRQRWLQQAIPRDYPALLLTAVLAFWIGRSSMPTPKQPVRSSD